MHRKITTFFALLIAAAPAFALDEKAVAEHLRETYNFPSDVAIDIGKARSSDVPGFDLHELTLSRGDFKQAEKLYVSKNGRHYLLGAFKDLKTNPDGDRLAKIDFKNSATRGSQDAKVAVVEYTDFQCPYCQIGYRVMVDKIMKEYEGKVKWVYKSLPLENIHPWALPAAVAAECARLQNDAAFWKVHDRMFEEQRSISFSNVDEKVRGYAKEAKLDMGSFDACYDGKKTAKKVMEDMAEAEALGVQSTPSFLVNGHRVERGADYDEIKRLVEESLSGKHGKL